MPHLSKGLCGFHGHGADCRTHRRHDVAARHSIGLLAVCGGSLTEPTATARTTVFVGQLISVLPEVDKCRREARRVPHWIKAPLVHTWVTVARKGASKDSAWVTGECRAVTHSAGLESDGSSRRGGRGGEGQRGRGHQSSGQLLVLKPVAAAARPRRAEIVAWAWNAGRRRAKVVARARNSGRRKAVAANRRALNKRRPVDMLRHPSVGQISMRNLRPGSFGSHAGHTGGAPWRLNSVVNVEEPGENDRCRPSRRDRRGSDSDRGRGDGENNYDSFI